MTEKQDKPITIWWNPNQSSESAGFVWFKHNELPMLGLKFWRFRGIHLDTKEELHDFINLLMSFEPAVAVQYLTQKIPPVTFGIMSHGQTLTCEAFETSGRPLQFGLTPFDWFSKLVDEIEPTSALFDKLKWQEVAGWLRDHQADKKKQQHRTRPEAKEVVPPGRFVKTSEHHWLEQLDSDGHSSGLVVLQWNPGAGKWSHSGNVGTGMYVNTTYWRYHSHCPIPE